MDISAIFSSALTALSGGSTSGKKYLLAVSGGMDSMCLADLFLNSHHHPAFGIAHVNFSLRGDESDGDEELTRTWAASHGIEFHTIRFDTSTYAGEHSLSIEMAARELRYQWFESLLELHHYDFLAVAHNRNDNAETLFLNLLRGCGISGITGIRKHNGRIIRPLLDITREDISKYVKSHSVPYRDDSTNFGTDYSRNKIRNLVFPVLKTINPSFIGILAEDMEHFSQAADILEETYASLKDRLTREENGITVIDIKALTATGHRDYYSFRLLSPFGFNSTQIRNILSSTASGNTFRSPEYELITDRDTLNIYPLGEETPSPVTIDGPGTFAFGHITLTLEIRPIKSDFDPHPASGTLYFDATDMKLPITCRSWRDGDRFRPFGMKGSRKISDFFTTLKLDVRAKNLQPILCDASGNIICIPPHRIDDRFRLNSVSKTVGVITSSDIGCQKRKLMAFGPSLKRRSRTESDGVKPNFEEKT